MCYIMDVSDGADEEETKMIIIERATPKGTKFAIEVRDGAAYAIADMPGAEAIGLSAREIRRTRKLAGSMQHSIAFRVGGRLAEIILSADEAEMIAAAIEASPRQLTAADLRAHRSSLVAAAQRDESAGEREWEREDEQGWARAQAAEATRCEAARKALAEFDAAHPEIVAEIKAARAAAIERAIAS